MPKNKREYKKSNDPNNLSHIKRPTYLKEAQLDKKCNFKTKYGTDGRFVGFPSIHNFVEELPEEGLNIYNELIPLKGFIPLYMDVEYYTTKPNSKPLNALLELLYHYCRMNFMDYINLDGVDIEEWKNYFKISIASRQDKKKNMYKNSFHLKLVGDCIDTTLYDTEDEDEEYYDTEESDSKIPCPYVYFESQNDIKVFLDNCINNWAANSTDPTIKHLYELVHISNETEAEAQPLGIVDHNVYTSYITAEFSQPFRMLYSMKQWFDEESQLIPMEGVPECEKARKLQILHHSISIDHSRNMSDDIIANRSKKIPCAHLRGFQETRKDPDTIMNQTAYKLSGVPEEEEAAAKLLIQNRLGPTCMIVGSDVTYNNDYAFNIQSEDMCLVCNEVHPLEFSSYKKYNYKLYHTPNTNKYKLYCCKENKKGGQYKKLNPIPSGIITSWDYRHEDGEFLCVPFNEPRGNMRKLEKGGTFFYEGPKGSGKTEALVRSLNNIPKSKSVLVLTYRVNLSNTYKNDFAKFGFSHYKDYHGKELTGKANQNKHRYIVLLDSIKKTVEIEPPDQKSYKLSNGTVFNNYVEKYDYVIIDEIYSVLEHWQSKLMGENKLYAMMLFENHVKRCGKLICLDAHLNNSMVVNTINKMRNPDKFICYKNPNAYDMSDYKVYYREQLYTPDNKMISDKNGLTEVSKFKDLIIEDLQKGKKLCVMGSTKAFVDQVKEEVKEKQKEGVLPQFEIKIYTSDTDKTQMKDDMENVKDVFANKALKLLLYSPTISAGISYNSNIPEVGFDKLYCCVQTGANVCSLNTTKQMLRRIRQLVEKEVHILFNRQKDPFPLRLDQIEKVLYDQSNDIHKYLGKPELCSSNQLDANMKIKYDRNRWDYNVWKENAIHRIKYEKHSNFTQGLKQSLCNSPDDDIEPGYGMKWIDCTTPFKMTEEQVKHSLIQQKKREELKTKADHELYKEYMNLEDYNQDVIDDIITRSKTGCAEKALDREEEMIMKRHEVFRVYGLDIQKWKAEADETIRQELEEVWKKMLRFKNVHQFNRQLLLIRALEENPEAPMIKIVSEINRRAVNHYQIALKGVEQLLAKGNSAHYTEQFSTMFDQLVDKDKKNLDTPQILEALYTQKLQQFPKCFEIMDLLGISPPKLVEGSQIEHSTVNKLLKNKELVKKLHKECHKQFPHLKFRKPGELYKSEINIRDALQKWQEAHVDTHILSHTREDVLNWLQTEGGLLDEHIKAFNKTDHLKVADFDKVHIDGKLPGKDLGKKIIPDILIEGNYWTSAMSESRWECCEVKKFLGLVSKILEDTTGYKCNELQEKVYEKERHRPYVIKNNKLFDLLKKYKLEINDPFAYSLMD